ncbi:MAG: DUF58 domain-containing protein [Phycisphaeraceae bacterium]
MTDGRRYLDPKVLAKITRLDVRARLVVEGFITGLHKSPYHGFAVEFATHREYVPGDEIKHIDWKVWARQDRFYIKEYEEETNLKCTIILDCSKSMDYGSNDDPVHHGMGKFEYAATAAACLAFLLQHQQDAVGLVAFDNDIRKNLPASSHPSHLKLILHELEQIKPDKRSDIGDVFHRLAEQTRKRGMIVLVSDLFVDLDVLADAMRHFRHRRHEVVVLHTLHDHELTFPFQDNTMFRGLEVESEVLAEPRALRKSYLEVLENFTRRVRKLCADLGIDYVPMSTKDPLDAALAGYLAFRQRTMRKTRR